MSHLLFWFVFVVVLSYVSVVLDRRREKIQQEQQLTAETPVAQAITATLTNASETINGLATRLANQWQQQRNGQLRPVNIPSFRAWLSSLFAPTALEQGWLTSLTDEQVQILHQGVATFAEDLGFDLAWLLEAKPFKSPTVDQAAKEIVLNYLRSWQQATQTQADIQSMKRYQALLANPTSKENQLFAQQLYTQLLSEGIGNPPPPALGNADKQAEQHFILENLQQIANQQPSTFSRTLKMALVTAKAPMQPTPQPRQKEVA